MFDTQPPARKPSRWTYPGNPYRDGRWTSSELWREKEHVQWLLAEADLVRELAEVTRAANRANATLYTIDPRGLVAGQDLDDEVPTQEWNAYVRDTQDSLRVLAEETGGIAVVNQNDFDKALKRIDAETSDYYVLGYYSSNPDPLRRTRKVEIKSTRPNLNIWSRGEYTLRPIQNPDQR